ncbi:MAG: MBL fold metallo-hydrolase [Desulforhabdus sp.]|jgi:flavorubredoxin|nr:MBL fold metallo-hydrolase [Desulforhabdus sp.]
MIEKSELSLDYSRSIQIAEGVFWIGFHDIQSGLHCNPYLITEGQEAVVIDGGSRPDFPSVMMKILTTGVDPSSIKALIYQHYDPDLCGSISNFEDIIDRDDLKIISCSSNHMFIRHYAAKSDLLSMQDLHYRYRFSSGRELRFTPTPYAHSEGSFVTFDARTGVLFTSDLFGSYGGQWELFLQLEPHCRNCFDYSPCSAGKTYCPLPDILKFHQHIIPSARALKYALEQMAAIPFSVIAPQHGSVIRGADIIEIVWNRLGALERVGIDRVIGDRSEFNLARKRSE